MVGRILCPTVFYLPFLAFHTIISLVFILFNWDGKVEATKDILSDLGAEGGMAGERRTGTPDHKKKHNWNESKLLFSAMAGRRVRDFRKCAMTEISVAHLAHFQRNLSHGAHKIMAVWIVLEVLKETSGINVLECIYISFYQSFHCSFHRHSQQHRKCHQVFTLQFRSSRTPSLPILLWDSSLMAWTA